jgi:hypothetical protein
LPYISNDEIALLSETARLEVLRFLSRRGDWIDLDRLDPETRDILAPTSTKGWRQ